MASTSFFDDDSDEDEGPRAVRTASINPARRAPYARQSSVSGASESSRAESSRRPNYGNGAMRGRGRYESTASPRTDRISDSAPMDTEDDMSSIGGGHRGGAAGRRGMDLDMDMDMYGNDGDRDGDRDDDGDGGGGGDPFDDDDELEGDMADVKRLGFVWVRERGTPDIMRWEGDLIDSIFDKLEQQQKLVDTLRSDPDTSEEEHFKLVLVMTEMERVKYLVRSYVRTRLWKIEKYAQYITITPEVQTLLSGAEIQHATRYTELLHTHFQHSVLDSLPEWLRNMDDTYGDGLSMIQKPNKNTPVLILCRRDCGEITLPDGSPASLGKGTTHLVKYHLVEQWVKLGWAEVL